MRTMRTRLRGRRQRGQALVEFSLSIIVFLVMLMGVFDVGRAIFLYNGVSEAAREIARRTSVHTFATIDGLSSLGSSPESRDAVAVQKSLVPGMDDVPPGAPNFECVDLDGAPVTTSCGWTGTQDYVRVTVTGTYEPITLLGLIGPITLSSTSTIAIPTNRG